METFRRILVATDFSEPAARATDLAIALGSKFGAQLILLHVMPAPPFYGYDPVRDWPLPIEDLPGEAQRALDDAKRELAERYARVEGVLGFGEPTERILAVAAERGAELIVMGTHGHRGVSHFLLGSVAEKVVRASSVPVLTVGPRGS